MGCFNSFLRYVLSRPSKTFLSFHFYYYYFVFPYFGDKSEFACSTDFSPKLKKKKSWPPTNISRDLSKQHKPADLNVCQHLRWGISTVYDIASPGTTSGSDIASLGTTYHHRVHVKRRCYLRRQRV